MNHEDVGYGFCAVEDPRDFTPDHECSTEDERERHRADCEAWDRGERPNNGGCHRFSPNGYGLGTYVMRWDCEGDPICPECRPPDDEAAPTPQKPGAGE